MTVLLQTADYQCVLSTLKCCHTCSAPAGSNGVKCRNELLKPKRDMLLTYIEYRKERVQLASSRTHSSVLVPVIPSSPCFFFCTPFFLHSHPSFLLSFALVVGTSPCSCHRAGAEDGHTGRGRQQPQRPH